MGDRSRRYKVSVEAWNRVAGKVVTRLVSLQFLLLLLDPPVTPHRQICVLSVLF